GNGDVIEEDVTLGVATRAGGGAVEQEPRPRVRPALDHEQRRTRRKRVDARDRPVGLRGLVLLQEVGSEDRCRLRGTLRRNAGPVVAGHLWVSSCAIAVDRRRWCGWGPRLRRRGGQACSVSARYASASSRPARVSSADASSLISTIQPSPYGLLFTSSGWSARASFTATPSPSTGAYTSDIVLVESISPISSPAVVRWPTSGSCSITTSPS